MKTLYLIRGLSNSGKTTLAYLITEASFAADDYFYNHKGEYNFDPSKLPEAHKYCQDSVESAMMMGEYLEEHVITVHNTFTQYWEMQPYFDLAKQYGYSVAVVHCEGIVGGSDNGHGVSDEQTQRMKDRWESFNPTI